MKYLRYYTCLLLVTFLATACSDDFAEENGYMPATRPYYIYAERTYFSFGWAAASWERFRVSSIDTPWKFEGQAPWVSLSPVSGGDGDTYVTLTVSENKSVYDSRTSVFSLLSTDEAYGYNTSMSVSQPAAGPSIKVSQDELSFSAATATKTVEVEANVEWTATTSSSWVTLVRKGDKLEITVTENTGYSSRSGYVYVTGGGVTSSIELNQTTGSVTSETTGIEVGNTPATVQLKINSETAWSASASDSWIEVTPESGKAGDAVLTVNIAANDNVSDRTGYVYVSVGGYSKVSIPVRQKGLYIESDVTSLSFAATGEALLVNVSSNTSWTVASCPDWITPSPASGTGDGRLTLRAADNPYTTSRSGYVHLKQEGLSLDVAISVNQTGKTFEVNTDVLDFSDKAGTKTFNIKTDGSWSATTADGWITLSPVFGKGDAELSVSVGENTYDDERTGAVAITMGKETRNVAVRQVGKYFTVSDEALQIGSTGGSVSISVATNDRWTAAFDGGTTPDWLSLSAASGNGTAEITVTAADNPSVNSRSAALVVATPHGQSVRIVVSQAARRLSVAANRVMLLSKGGTSRLVEVDTDGKYKVEAQGGWFTVATAEGGFTVTAGPNTTGSNRTGSVLVSLTDLEEGTLQIVVPVVQTVSGATFLKVGYGTDTGWNFENGTLTLTLSGYGADEDWNAGTDAVFKVVRTGYTDDHNWNNTNYGAGTVGRTDFGADENHDKEHGKGGSVDREDYGGDSDWTPQE